MFGNAYTAREIIRNYDCAKRLYDTTKPIRGRKEDVRPIGNRRSCHHTLKAYNFKREGAPHETINCIGLCYGNTEVVTYRDDGIVGINMGRWNTVSTAEFINSYTHMECVKRHKRLWITGARDIKYPLEPEDTFYLYRGNPIRPNDHWTPSKDRIKSDYKGTYFMDAPVKIYRDAVDQGRMRKLRDRLKPLLTYLNSMHKMSGGAPVSDKFYEKYAGKYLHNGSNPPLEAMQLVIQRYYNLDGYKQNFPNDIGDEGEYLASVGFYDYIDKIKDNPTNYNRLVALLCHMYIKCRESRGSFSSFERDFTFEDIAVYTVKVLSDGGYKTTVETEPSRKYYTKVVNVDYEY
jgi:hypothetical protein